MKALFKKDVLIVVKQMKFVLLVIVVFSAIPENMITAMAVMNAMLMAINTIAFDERSKWDTLAAMMPYSKRDIVTVKYLFGYICIIGSGAIAILSRLVISAVGLSIFDFEALLSCLFLSCGALVMLPVLLPLVYRLGVEKGRIAYIAVIVFIFAFSSALFSDSLEQINIVNASTLSIATAILFVAAAVINPLSIALSTSIYKKKMFK